MANESVVKFKNEILAVLHKNLVGKLQSKSIYRNVKIPNFIFLDYKYFDLEIRFNFSSLGDHTDWYGLTLISSDKVTKGDLQYNNIKYITTAFEGETYGLRLDEYTTDEQFVQVVKKLHELIENFDEVVDKLYPDINDKKRIQFIKKELSDINEKLEIF